MFMLAYVVSHIALPRFFVRSIFIYHAESKVQELCGMKLVILRLYHNTSTRIRNIDLNQEATSYDAGRVLFNVLELNL